MNVVTRALVAAMRKMRLDPATFASLLDVDVADVQAWEAGSREAKSTVFIRCAQALALTVEELLNGDLAGAAMPTVFLRATAHEGKLDDLLDLSGDLALFVETARAIDRLAQTSGRQAPALPDPPVDPKWGIATAPYRADELSTWLRKKLGITTPNIPSMRAIYDQLGITVVWARREEMCPNVDGASLRSPRPCALVHLVEGPLCWWRTRMTLAHELCHLLCDFTDEQGSLALVSPTSNGDAEAAPGSRAAGHRTWNLFKGFDWIEQRASAFASHFLVPDDALREALSGQDPVSEEAVSTVCGRFGVGRITAVSRLKHVFKLSEELRLSMLRRPHEERHAIDHPDIPPARHGIRGGVLLDEAAAALAEGRIDRVEAHGALGLLLTEWLPEHPRLSDKLRAPLRTVDEDVRSIVRIRLARTGEANLHPTEVCRREAGWSVRIVDAEGRPVREELLSFDLDAERAQPSA